MEQPIQTSMREMNKTEIDVSPPGSLMISADASTSVKPVTCVEAFDRTLLRIRNEHALVLGPLRLILLTAELGNAVRRWQRALGLPEAGVSQQPEGVAVAKSMSWGTDEKSARSIIILADSITAGIVANNSIAISALAHELGHVHDEFSRSLVLGFSESLTTPSNNDWPSICAYLAEMTWSEYAAESIGASYMTPENLRVLLLNDPLHLAGVHERLRQAVWSYKLGKRTLVSLWNGSVTELGDIFANLGRAIARLPFADNYEEALGRLVSLRNEAACWEPVIERLVQELEALGNADCPKWGTTPFSRIQQVIVAGFEAVGLFPTYEGGSLHVRVP
jgi:hypothetical protein